MRTRMYGVAVLAMVMILITLLAGCVDTTKEEWLAGEASCATFGGIAGLSVFRNRSYSFITATCANGNRVEITFKYPQ